MCIKYTYICDMRINKHIPNYLLGADGQVINKETGEIEQKINATEYRLQTSEKVYLETKNKTIELVRRFTDSQIMKLYNDGTEYKEVSGKPEKTKAPKVSQVDLNSQKQGFDEVGHNDSVNVGQKSVKSGTVSKGSISINGTVYDSLRQASEQLGISKSNIDRRIKSEEFPTYFKIE